MRNEKLNQIAIKKLFTILFLFFPYLLFAQESVFKGKVVDSETNESLIGVVVQEKGTNNATITDVDGHFSLKVANETTIVFSYLGYKNKELQSSSQFVTVLLDESTKILDEIVVVGYGVQKKKLITGATVQVGANDIQKMNTVSAVGALQSQSPGVNITQGSGMPGENFKVTIRGLGTVGDSAPLYVIDGVAGADINSLNPSDIESIDILKDAASAAIYGARAANGVILVTTKQAKAGKMQISYDGYMGIQNMAKKPKLLDAMQYMDMMNEMRVNDNATPYDFASLIPGEYNSIVNGAWKGSNWLDEIENKNAPVKNHSINIIGGSDQTKLSLGFSYTSQEGILGKPANPNYERYTARINSEAVLLKGKGFDIIKVGENLTYSFTEKSGIGIGGNYDNDIRNMLNTTPLLPIYNKNGGYYDREDKIADAWTLDGNIFNPIAMMIYERGNNANKHHTLQGNAYLEIQPIKDLRFKSSFGYKMDASSMRWYNPTYSLSNTDIRTIDMVTQEQNLGYKWTMDNTISYNFKINKDHSIDAVLGQAVEKWGIGEQMKASNGNTIFPGSWKNAWLSNTQGISATYTSLSGTPLDNGSLASFFGRANYNYKETYLASVVMRADGSSNFAKGKRWGYFPSLSVGWVMTNEPFMKKTESWLDFFKLRASWGQNGNCNIVPFQYLATYAFGTNDGYFFGDDKGVLVTGSYADILANPDVTWETSDQINVGFDSRYLKGRLGVVFDLYQKKTKDWLVQAPILSSFGTGAPFINGGDITNKGVEIGLNWNDNISEFNYGANFNLSYNKNEVTRIANTEGIIHGNWGVLSHGTAEMYRAQVGYPIGYFYGYKTAGVFQNQAQIDATKAKLNGVQPGDLIFVDTDGDGYITEEDRVKIGKPNPDVIIGFSINMSYKGFDFAMAGSGAFGHQIAKSYRSFVDRPLQNFTTEILDRWHGEGTSNKLPRLTNGGHSNWLNISDIYIENADYVKIQNITVGYDFKKLFSKMPLGQARLYLSAQNLFTITGYSGMDPEVGYGPNSWASGIDLGFYPSPRTYMVGLNLKF